MTYQCDRLLLAPRGRILLRRIRANTPETAIKWLLTTATQEASQSDVRVLRSEVHQIAAGLAGLGYRFEFETVGKNGVMPYALEIRPHHAPRQRCHRPSIQRTCQRTNGEAT